MLRPLAHADRDGAVQQHDGIGFDPRQLAIEVSDLPPVGLLRARGFGMHRGNRGLQLIGADPTAPQRCFDQRQSLADLDAIPQRAVLLFEGHQHAGGVDPGPAARIVQQHQCQQAEIFRLGRVDVAQHMSEPDRLGAQLAAGQCIPRRCEVAFVEDQVDDRLHRGAAVAEPVLGRHLVRDARVVDFALGAHQTLRQGRLGNEKGAGDLAGGKPAQGAQSQRDLRLAVERGMTAGKDQPQPVVGKRRERVFEIVGIFGRRGHRLILQDSLLFAAGALATARVDQLAAGGGRDPGTRVGRNAARVPVGECGGKRLLHRLLGAVERAAQPDQAGDDPAMLAAEHRLRRGTDFGRLRHRPRPA